jgi:hypothetical protein
MKTSVHLDRHTTNFEYQLYLRDEYKGVERPAFVVMRLNQLQIFLSPEQMIDLAKVVNKAVKEIES